MHRTRSIWPVVAVAVALGPSTAGAQQPTLRDPAFDDELETQMNDDISPIPAGMGAIFVPALTESALEPPIVVYHEEQRIASGRAGTRIVVPPGKYRVVAGHGPRHRRPSATVVVDEGLATPVQPFFGALRVHVVDDDGRPVDDSYVIKSTDVGTVYGPVRMSVDPDGPRQATWIVPPGTYRIAVGTDPDTDEDSVELVLHPGEVLRYRLVVAAGDLLRADLSDQPFRYDPDIWRLRWTLGGSLSLDSRNDQLVHQGREYALASLFSRFEGGIDTGPHLALGTLNVDHSLVWLDSDHGLDFPVYSLTSEAEAELLYVFRAARVIGPYVRGNVRTSYLQSHYFPDEDIVIETRDEEGSLLRRSEVSAGERLRLFEEFSPLVLQEGAGANLTVVDLPVFDLTFRAGVAARQAFYRDGRFIDDYGPGRLTLTELDDRTDFGGEAIGVAGLRLGNSFALSTDFDSFLNYELFTGDQERFPFRWDSRASWHLNRFASATYTFSLRRDEVVMDDLQWIHGLALTLQWAVFGGLRP